MAKAPTPTENPLPRENPLPVPGGSWLRDPDTGALAKAPDLDAPPAPADHDVNPSKEAQ